MKAPIVKILTPCYGGNITSQYFQSIISLFPYAIQNGIGITIETLPNCSLISLGRSYMMRKALEDESWSHVMWIDSDLKFRPEYIHSMLLDDKDIIGGMYPKKGLPIDFASSPDPVTVEDNTDFVVETRFVATGFMLIKREVIEKMYEHFKDELTFVYHEFNDIVDLYGTFIIDNKMYLTEDYAFCVRAQSLGFRSWLSNRFELPHIGQIEYSAEYEKVFLEEYERSGRITINRDKEPNYFSAYKDDPQR